MTGEYQHTIDAKGRLFMPARLRDELGDIFYVTKGPDSCLFAFPMAAWRELERKVNEKSMAESRNFRRKFFASALRCELDAQGRILLTAKLRAYAALDKEVIIIGVSDHAEIWDLQTWERFEETELSGETLADEMAELGL